MQIFIRIPILFFPSHVLYSIEIKSNDQTIADKKPHHFWQGFKVSTGHLGTLKIIHDSKDIADRWTCIRCNLQNISNHLRSLGVITTLITH